MPKTCHVAVSKPTIETGSKPSKAAAEGFRVLMPLKGAQNVPLGLSGLGRYHGKAEAKPCAERFRVLRLVKGA